MKKRGREDVIGRGGDEERRPRRRSRRLVWALAAAAACAALGDWHARARADGGPGAQPVVYSGVLEEEGQLASGERLISVALFEAEQGGTARCSSPDNVVIAVESGRFTVELPAECADAVRDAPQLWGEVRVEHEALSPRSRVAAVPYALEASHAAAAAAADGALRGEIDEVKSDLSGKLTVSGEQLVISPEGNVGVGTASPAAQLHVAGDMVIGARLPVGEPPEAAGWGAAAIFAGGPVVIQGWDSDNSDPLWLARYNVAPNVTELRAVIGDDPGQAAERFVIGAMQGSGVFTKNANWNPVFSFGMDGVARTAGSFNAGESPDIAETIPADSEVRAADAVCADLTRRERAVRCKKGDTAVLGVIATGRSSFLINAGAHSVDGPLTGQPLVLAGRVPVRVSLENGPIRIGDALAPSSLPGAAMRAAEPGPVVGIALEPYDGRSGEPAVLCFVSPGAGGIAQLVSENARLRDRSAAIEAENAAIRAENAAIQRRLARLEEAVSALGRRAAPPPR